MENVKDYIDDTAITAAIKAKLATEKLVSALDIHVETNKGEVILSGKVPSKIALAKTKDLAQECDGVKNVITDLTIEK
jgi:osmotically-inducible protein OsmY